MPRGPKSEKRPADVIGAVIMVANIARGEIDEKPAEIQTDALPNGGPRLNVVIETTGATEDAETPLAISD